jgi:4-diphosphocytidyl-2-C-methyl-D-erythritol kinase
MGAEKTRLANEMPRGVENSFMRFKSYLNRLCPAKVNLILRVGRRRLDGYHEIETLMVKTGWGDRLDLRVRTAQATKISLKTPGLRLAPEKNLVYRAAEKFSRAFGAKFEAQIVLEKLTPTGAGLGGGSSDAAKTLELLYDWQFGRLRQGAQWRKLCRLAAKLGADVPFFLGGSAAWCTGFGEKIEAANVPKLWIVLVFPDDEVSTPWAYGEIDRARGKTRQQFLRGRPAWLEEKYSIPLLENDFEVPVVKAKARLRGVRELIAQSGACAARMSGSGSTFFGLYSSAQDAKAGAKFLRGRGCRVMITQSGK